MVVISIPLGIRDKSPYESRAFRASDNELRIHQRRYETCRRYRNHVHSPRISVNRCPNSPTIRFFTLPETKYRSYISFLLYASSRGGRFSFHRRMAVNIPASSQVHIRHILYFCFLGLAQLLQSIGSLTAYLQGVRILARRGVRASSGPTTSSKLIRAVT